MSIFAVSSEIHYIMRHLYRYCRYCLACIFLMCLAFMGCVPEDIELPCRIKSVATDTALSISAHRARLSGKVAITDADSISCGIIYDVSSTLSSTKGTMKSTKSVGDYFVEVSELNANTTYYYRAYAVEAETYKYGKIHSFKTDISVVTGTAKDVTHNAATLSGEIDSDGKSLTCGIIYGTSSVLSDTNGTKVSTTSKGKYVIDIADLNANTTYYYCAYAIIGNTYKYGKVLSFKTGVSVVTGEATDISESGATLAGTVEGNNNTFDCGIIYATSSAALLSSGTKIAATSKDEHYSITLADLSANTTYYYCAYAVVNGQYVYGEVKSFTTHKVLSVITGAASNIGTNKATVSCVVYGASESITCGVIYGTTDQLSSTSGSRASTTSKGSYSINLESLKENTTYYYRAYIVVDKEYRYGDIRSFKTSQTSQPSQSVSVTTDAASDITYKSALLNGTLEGSTSSVACGFIYGKTSTLSSTSGTKVSTSSSGAYSIFVSDLDANTTYYYRAYALINGQYIYGTVSSFTTKLEITITTNEASDITSHGAVLSGTVSNAEQSISCGIIYGTSINLSSTSGTKLPTTSQGTFSLNLADLTPNTTYYYCAYVIIDGKYKYGEILSFNTEQEDKTGTVGEAIDLGLSVKWASWNVGASSPEEYGDYFAWGETVTKSIYYDNNSVIYGLSISELESRGIISSDGNLTAEYDAATANWSGSWRMPTKAEQVELLANCTWEWTTQNGVNGYKVTGVNGNFIFLPAAGYRPGTSLYDAGSYGIYWSATLYDNSAYACDLSFDSSEYGWHRSYCSFGLTVRPVYSEAPVITITTGEATDITTDGATLSGVVSNATGLIGCGFIYGTSSDMSSLNNKRISTASDGIYSISVSNLQPGTTYYYCAYTIIGGEERYGEVFSFTTEQEVVDNPSVSYETFMVNGVSFRMIDVEGGTFTMGAPNSDSDARDNEKPAHQVTLSSYAIGETEVTQELWQAVMGNNPSNSFGKQKPVEGVSWYDCQEFISKLNDLTGENFRLPTEAEWEYAARGGNASQGYKYSGSNAIDDVAWYSKVETYIVKTKQPNELCIYDMSGNVGEWCTDWYSSSYYSYSPENNPAGPYSGSNRVIRGGSSYYNARDCRVTYRNYGSPDGGGGDVGFRLVRSDKPLQTIIVSTGEVTDITTNSATLSGVVSNATQAISCGIIYGTSSDMSSLNNNREATSSDGTYSISVSNLQPGTTYYYCAYAVIGGEERYGEVYSFTTQQEEQIGTVGEAIDLGLSVKWASWNVGASSPEEYGNYFAWGETTTKFDYSSSTSVTHGLSSSELRSRGIIDANGNLTAAYDAATVNWDDKWRIPTSEEIEELLNCTWEWTTMNDVNGYEVTGPNGNSIFLPAAGRRKDVVYDDVETSGYYWSAKRNEAVNSLNLYFYSGVNYLIFGFRYCGHTVRPVYGEPQSNVTITTGEVTDITADGATLSGVVGNATESISCGFIYGTSSDMSSLNNNREAASSDGTYSISVSNLQPGTTYYYCAYAIIGGEERYGEVCSFTTLQVSGENTSSYEAVDLGLSVKWATCNVGADSPEDYGDYFAWGETTTKTDYSDSNSVTYGLSISELESRGIIDANGNLTAVYDAATVNWGGYWRMPTETEINELCTECDWELTAMNGVYGYMVKSRTNDNSIFLPAAGYRHGTSLYFEGSASSGGFYWSSPAKDDDDESYILYFYLDYNYGGSYNSSRRDGYTVRPVSDK